MRRAILTVSALLLVLTLVWVGGHDAQRLTPGSVGPLARHAASQPDSPPVIAHADRPRADPVSLAEVLTARELEVHVRVPGGVDARGEVRALRVTESGATTVAAHGSFTHDTPARLTLTHDGVYRVVAEGRRVRLPGGNLPSRHEGLGSAASGPIFVGDEPLEALTLELRGEGVIRGRVVDPSGELVLGLPIEVTHAELDRLDGEARAERASELALEGLGANGPRALVTGGEGTFEIHGLRRDAFVVDATVRGPDLTRTVRLTPTPVPADGALLELRIEAPRLVIRLVERGGVPLEPALLDAVAFGLPIDSSREGAGATSTSGDPATLGVPESPRLLVTAALESASVLGGRRSSLRAKRLDDGRFGVDVDSGVTYLVGVLGRSRPWRPQRVVVPEGAGTIEVELELPPPEPSGALCLELRDSAGEPVRERVQVTVGHVDDGSVLFVMSDNAGEGADPLRIELPAGRYRVRAEGFPVSGRHFATVGRSHEHGGAERVVEVRAGVDTRATLALGAGATLHVRTAGRLDASDRAAVREGSPGLTDERADFFADKVYIALAPPGSWNEAVWFEREPMPGKRIPGRRLFSWLPLETEATSERIPAGRYTLIAALLGGRRVEREVELFDGSTTEVFVEFH